MAAKKTMVDKLITRLKQRLIYHRVERVKLNCKIEHHGGNYGGWTICPDGLSQNSVVYSFGIGEDITFDLSLIEKYHLQVFAFDPTPRSREWIKKQSLPTQFHVMEYGLADFDGEAAFYPPENSDHVSHTLLQRANATQTPIQVKMLRLSTIMSQLNHQHIDILKMDIEGSEYAVINDLLKTNPSIGQILIEFHHHFPEIHHDQTISAIRQLKKMGFHIFHISERLTEFSFIKGAH